MISGMGPIEDDAPSVRTNADRQRDWRKRNPEKRLATRKKYRHENSKHETNAKYLSRPFIAWDGEGITREDGAHIYVMFAVKGAGQSDYIFNENGLGTREIFEFILDFAERASGIHVIYGGGYDFNMWLRDLPLDKLEEVYAQRYVLWNGYRIAWRKGKSFYVARVGPDGKSRGGVTMYDCASFFQRPFIDACDSYLDDNFYKRGLIVRNKALRSSFTAHDVDEVREYNDAELVNLVRLMDELRQRLNKAGLRPRRWDGPGAVASALMLREGVKAARAESPESVARAARKAYAGGRFEVIRFGSVAETAYEYDINSAYPAALRAVPNLAAGEWRYREGDSGSLPFAIYRVEYRGKRRDLPGAFFCRAENGTVSYPMRVKGWYWSPEIETAREYCARGYGEMQIVGAWEFVPHDDSKPFGFIDKLYRARKILKKQGDGAHVGIKLGLNSLYGKLAQQVGAEKRAGAWRIPPFHQIEWAGYTTSYCRARILRACLDNLESVIAFETDAVFTSAPLSVPEGEELGDFERVEFERLTYIQSGMYFGRSEGKDVAKTRGIDYGSLDEKTVLAKFSSPAIERYARASLTRFVGLGIALAQNMERWRRWETMEKRVSLEPTGKRIHAACACMNAPARGIAVGQWHRTVCPVAGGESVEFPVLWASAAPLAEVLAELRDEPPNWE